MRFLVSFLLIAFFTLPVAAQEVTYSNYDKEDIDDMNFEIIGKMNGNFVIYKNIRWKHRISILNDSMKIKQTIKLDFIPEKTFNIDFITYPDFFYMIYQYQKKNILYCMMMKMDGNGNKLSEPVELDTTKIPVLADNKIYTTINSEDKKKIMIFKINKKDDNYTLASKLFDDSFHLIHANRQNLDIDDRRDNYDNFVVDNDGYFAFTKDSKKNSRESSSLLKFIMLAPTEDTFSYHNIDLGKYYLDEVKLKPDNLNKKFLIHSFYSSKSRGNIDGLFTTTWNRKASAQVVTAFLPITDSLRDEAKQQGQLRYAMDDFFIREQIIKKDGGYVLIAEDFSTETRTNNNAWNRWDYLRNPFYTSSSSYYYYNRGYGFYRPISTFSNAQSTRYYYNNILVINIDKYGRQEWAKVFHKDQFDDDNDNFVSYFTMMSGGEIHFLFNINTKHQIIADQSVTGSGEMKRYATIKSEEKGYEFMTRLSKQITAKQIIVPCAIHGKICFAKIDLP